MKTGTPVSRYAADSMKRDQDLFGRNLSMER
jgi:hypothetical protein